MHFSFRLNGRKWFGLYLAILVFYVVPAIAIQLFAKHIQSNPKNTMNLLYFFSMFLIMAFSILILVTPILKKIINSTYLNGKPLKYSGKIAEFVWLNIGRSLLSLISFGIYFPWYMTRLMKYLVGRTSYGGNKLLFNGKGIHLFGLLIGTLLVPMILYSAPIALIGKGIRENIFFVIASQIIVCIILIPYAYFLYRWMINIAYKEYSIKWKTQHIQSMGKILVEVLLTVITVGIYYPVAIAKLYEYFINRTFAYRQGAKNYSFMAKLGYFNVWKTVWIQVLLTIVSCGLYGAWAYCKILALFINNTSIAKLETAQEKLTCD